MDKIKSARKPLQGVLNIVRFNWHFFAFSIICFITLLLIKESASNWISLIIDLFLILILLTTTVSLLVSYYIYDYSDLYKLSWLEKLDFDPTKIKSTVNIHSGFDETSSLLKEKLKNIELSIFDFYDPTKHTEVSIKRARKAYPACPETQLIDTNNLPLIDNSIDLAFLILSAHEIRDEDERIAFFKELYRSIKPSGKIIVVEHLRDLNNFLAYNIGYLHFHSKNSWLDTFKESNLKLKEEFKITPFINVFLLNKPNKNGNLS